MIPVYLLLATGLSIYDIYNMKKQAKSGRDIFVYVFFMTASAVLGIIYLYNPYQTGIADILLKLFDIRW